MAIIDGKIRCPECSQQQGLELFEPRDIDRGSGYCRPCKRERKRQWYALNKGKDAARRRELYEARKSPEGLRALQRRREIRSEESLRGRKKTLVRHNLLSRYGMSEDDYNALSESQGGVCGCCGTAENTAGRRLWCVDHDHETGQVRGLLCVRCNVGLGALGDDIKGLRRALAYLARAELKRVPPRMRINLLRGEESHAA